MIKKSGQLAEDPNFDKTLALLLYEEIDALLK